MAGSRLRVVTALALVTLAKSAGKRAPGTGPYKANGPCPNCRSGVLKKDDKGLYCKKCARRPGDTGK